MNVLKEISSQKVLMLKSTRDYIAVISPGLGVILNLVFSAYCRVSMSFLDLTVYQSGFEPWVWNKHPDQTDFEGRLAKQTWLIKNSGCVIIINMYIIQYED